MALGPLYIASVVIIGTFGVWGGEYSTMPYKRDTFSNLSIPC